MNAFVSPSRIRPRQAVLSATVLLALGLSGCAGAPASEEPAGTGVPFGPTTAAAATGTESVTWMLPQEPATFDLDVDSGTAENTILSNVCERLMQVQPDLTTVPHLAETAEWTSDTTVVFTLRPDVTFHDGTAMTAEDVLWSMQRHAAEGADESDEYANVTDMAKTGENEITVTLKQRDAIFLQAMAGNGGIVLNRKVVEAQGAAYGTPSSPDACSGPLQLESWTSGSSVTLAKAADYWDAENASLAGSVTFKWADENAIVNSLTSGDAQGAYLDSPASAVPLQKSGNVTVAQGPATNVWSLMATERGLLKDEKIRQALSLALNRQGIADAAFGGLAQPWKTPVGSGAWGYERETFSDAYDALAGAPATPSEDDLAQARKLVEEAGSPTEPLIVANSGDSIRNVVSSAVVAAAESIGLKAEIITIPRQQYGDFYSDAELRAQADLFSDEYYISKNDPVGFYKNGASTAKVNFVQFSGEGYDEAVKEAQATTDDAARAALAIGLQEQWVEAAVWVPVVQTPTTLALAGTVTGAPSSAAFLYYPWAADIGSTKK
ncbi:ABC transporter substrate-binding protein [Arthrobacter sp. Helios]|uniref:ABC transporter substrate-binding protein n=1 Tax=Arthrobacter sp. Helios TaxID=2828862 RepID=UPI00205E2A37|nr:ABC transporter substrate-binding protein [Arthrobacter sp. Helios]UPO76546.1 ABC transporter substrate-binding protein [Arthrobacter sp. Helios]